ncbi:MAG: DMT family transporter [Planctomycetes bacterium]|jgi:drug/metabolite transporter (DMT)-like permease|nr:DMT family transporter [Planctomycetota bacterium]
MIQAILTSILFAMSAVSAGRSTRLLGAGTANLCRLLLATGFLALWAHLFGGGLGGVGLPWLFASGIIGFGVGDLALYGAYCRLGPRLGVLLCLCLAAPLGALIEWVWLGTRLTVYQTVWGATILAGVFAALAPDARVAMAPRTWGTGILLGTIAAFGQGSGAVLTRKAFDVAGQAGQSIDGGTAAYQRILGGLLLTIIFLTLNRGRQCFPPSTTEIAAADRTFRRAWPWVLANALAGPTLGVAFYQWALAIAPTGIVLSIVATTPLVVIPFTMVLDGERPTVRSLVGGAIAVLGAAALAYR